MAKVKLTGRAARDVYRKQLQPPLRADFDRICKLLDEPAQHLIWYHRMGVAVRAIHGSTRRYGSQWYAELAKALGPSTSIFVRAARFVEFYPDERDVQPLIALGVDWTRLVLTFSIPDEQKRYELLDEAITSGWTIPQVRFEVQRRYPSKRGGIGGRPKGKLRNFGPEISLRELARFTERWLEFHEKVWAKITPETIQKLIAKETDNDLILKTIEKVSKDLERMSVLARSALKPLAGITG